MRSLALILALAIGASGCQSQPKPTRPPVNVAPAPAVKPPVYQIKTLAFTASWCGPCRQQKPKVYQIVREGHVVLMVDVDKQPALASKYKITAVPTYVVFDWDREVARFHSADELGNYLNRIKPRKLSPQVKPLTVKQKKQELLFPPSVYVKIFVAVVKFFFFS